MEYFWNNDGKVATNVFELGLKTYAQEPEYVLQYLEHLIRTNNPNSAYFFGSLCGLVPI